jgi:DNA replication ATP-dependent helicase Dna2
MIYTRDGHNKFLEREQKAQCIEFKNKINTRALVLLQETEELFLAQFIKIENWQMILKFSKNRWIPRKNDHLLCFSTEKELRDYRKWENRTYWDLLKSWEWKTECVCVWSKDTDDNKYKLVWFRWMGIEFSDYINDNNEILLFLWPKTPPIEYISNLQNIVQNNYDIWANSILDRDYSSSNFIPTIIDNNNTDFIIKQLSLQDNLIIQWPPWTGKSHFIASIVRELVNKNKSILITALTNHALSEIVGKSELSELLANNKIHKTNLSIDESNLYKNLNNIKDVYPMSGNVILSTFYITSWLNLKEETKKFDYVIVDEASQALLSMFACTSLLWTKNLWLWDVNQLDPVVILSSDRIKTGNYSQVINWFKTLSENSSFPVYQFADSYRLNERSARYTGIFYDNTLVSKSNYNNCELYNEIDNRFKLFLNPKWWPTFIKSNFNISDLTPNNWIEMISELVKELFSIDKKLHISVLTNFKRTVNWLQKRIDSKKNLLIETVHRVQWLTTDICIYLIVNWSYHHSLNKRLFNVATSRARQHTIIIADENILTYLWMDKKVREYLQKL